MLTNSAAPSDEMTSGTEKLRRAQATISTESRELECITRLMASNTDLTENVEFNDGSEGYLMH